MLNLLIDQKEKIDKLKEENERLKDELRKLKQGDMRPHMIE